MAEIDRSVLQRTVAVINNKGGVGKTTLTTNVGGLLAASGWRVLIVDLDHQGNAGLDLGYRNTEKDDDGANLLKALIMNEQLHPVEVRPNLDVVVGGSLLENANGPQPTSASKRGDARLSVARALEPIAGDYDIILLDCPPSSDVIQSAAVAAARYVLVPVKTDRASLEGLALTANRLSAIYQLNPDIDLLGIVLFSSTTSAVKVREEFIGQIVEVLVSDDAGSEERDAAKKSIFDNFVRNAEAVANSARNKGVLVHELDEQVRKADKWWVSLRKGEPAKRVGPASSKSVADDLQAITQELVARLTELEAEAEAEETNV
ncbi:ParA family protein [Herbiconiux sp. VKM Ac-2851]|uniref:ParA family protein n=1 Tax=Herbiconiux sp. VKM Ac-2851 TaxID=2739025 RepID=UPI001567AEA1|nr:ParA family protein [Herbiconiux sp. VKM Ac-2851]NQX37088.1 ParA family protein [Herbiconiux sp. VKM Ac-2851]